MAKRKKQARPMMMGDRVMDDGDEVMKHLVHLVVAGKTINPKTELGKCLAYWLEWDVNFAERWKDIQEAQANIREQKRLHPKGWSGKKESKDFCVITCGSMRMAVACEQPLSQPELAEYRKQIKSLFPTIKFKTVKGVIRATCTVTEMIEVKEYFKRAEGMGKETADIARKFQLMAREYREKNPK